MEPDKYEEEALELSKSLGFYSSYSPEEEEDEDDEYDEFLTKRMRARRDKRRKLRKSGVSRKEARKTARREVRQELGRSKFGELGQKIKKSKFGQLALKVGKGLRKSILIPSLAIPRGSFLALVGLNWRGYGSRIYRVINDPKEKKKFGRLTTVWRDLGGNMKSLEKSAWNGNRKKAIMCGTKCKIKAVKYNKKSVAYKQTVKGGYRFSGADGGTEFDAGMLQKDLIFSIEALKYDNYEPVHITVGALITSALGIVSQVASTIKGVKQTKQNQEALDQAKKDSDRQFQLLSSSQKSELALAEKQMANQLDPRTAVLNNPNLTPAQKREAIAQIDDALGTKKTGMGKKILIGSGILVGVILIIWVISKATKKGKN